MRIILWIVVLLQLQLYIETVVVDHEQKCDEMVLPGFGDCTCDYEDKLDESQHQEHDLVRINCTDLKKDNVLMREMLSELSEHLNQTGYTHLEELIFVGNRVYELPTNLVGRESLAYLERLDLSNNGIHTIRGKTFHSMPILNELILDNNEWHVDPRSSRVFSSIFNIEVLSLNNAFTTDEDTSMHVTSLSVVFEDSKLDYLRKLSLEHNRMLEVSAEVFQKLPSLEVLSLANNNINSLDGIWNSTCFPSEYVDETMLLDHRCPLRKMDLSNNHITSVCAGFIDEIQKLKDLVTVDLTNNPFTCDCHLLPFYDFIMTEIDKNDHRVANMKQLTCAEPSYLGGRPLIGLSREELSCESLAAPTAPEAAVKHHKHVAAIVFGVLFSIIALIVLIALYINRDSVKRSLPSDLTALKRYLPGSSQGYKKFEFKDEKVEPVGV